MKRSEIKALFPDATKDQIDSIMDLHGEGLESVKTNYKDFVPKSELETVAAELKALKEAKQDDKTAEQLAELEALRKENEGFKTEKLNMAKSSKFNVLLDKSAARPGKDEREFLFMKAGVIELDDKGEIKNGDDVIKALKESCPSYFGTKIIDGAKPSEHSGGAANGGSATLESAIRERLKGD